MTLTQRTRNSGLWPLLAMPGVVWLAVFFLAPLYVVLAIVFGQVDPIFRTPIPVWNPLEWNPSQFTYVLTHICLLYTSPSPRDGLLSRMPSSA